MTQTIGIALLSHWHVHAVDYAREVLAHANLHIVTVWDEDPVRGQAWAAALDVPFTAQWEDVLADPAVRGVVVTTPTRDHARIITAAAEAGKHIFTEKVLGLTLAECDAIGNAVVASGVQLMVSLPRLTEAPYLCAQQVLDDGQLGTLSTIRCRVAHGGSVPTAAHPQGWLPAHFYDAEACGGGALIDLGAHPIYLTGRLAGPALSVTARLLETRQLGVDDQAVVLVEYAGGVLGIIETGFLTAASPFTLELHGTTGSLIIEDTRVRLKLAGEDWRDLALPPRLPSPMEQWVAAILHGTKPTLTWTDFRHLTHVNVAAKQSNDSGTRIRLAVQ